MLYMRKDKKEAVRLRKIGMSYNEIKTTLGVPKSTLSDWLKTNGWSDKIKRLLIKKAQIKSTIRLQKLNLIRGKHLAQLYEEARSEAKSEFEHFKLYPLFVAGVAIYWGEGDKATRNLRLGNTDPAMIKIFVKFLREICGAEKEKIRAYVLLYPDLDSEHCKNFWIEQSGLTGKNFNKCVIIQGRHKTRRTKYGVCTVGISSSYLKEKMFTWLDLLPKELISRNIAGVVQG